MNIEESSFQFLDSIPKIRVVIRKRPLTKRELAKSEQDIVEVRGTQSVIVREAKQKVDLTKYIEEHLFNFDRAFDETSTNNFLYGEAVRPLVDALFSKAKCTCFAYGQTGSGKTFTMMGNSGENQNPIPGLYLLAAQDIFALLDQQQFRHLGVFISFYEIYCGKLHDLLNERQEVYAREDNKHNVNIVGLSEKRVVNVHSLMQIIDFGNSVRMTGSTSANSDSSRSHAILQISLKENNKPFGKMSFIDLAGSERGADVADTKKQTRMDGAEINKSLLALKECIRALDQDKKHTPFRGSKLTLVLKDSFTGNCKTVMIGNISPSGNSCEHTLNTLRYADRVKELKKPQDGTTNSGPMSQLDILAQQLMLPRMQKNTTKIMIKEDDDDKPEAITKPLQTQNNPISNLNSNANKARFSTSSVNMGSTSSLGNLGLGLSQQQQQNSFHNRPMSATQSNFSTQASGLYNNTNWNSKLDQNGLFNITEDNFNGGGQQMVNMTNANPMFRPNTSMGSNMYQSFNNPQFGQLQSNENSLFSDYNNLLKQQQFQMQQQQQIQQQQFQQPQFHFQPPQQQLQQQQYGGITSNPNQKSQMMIENISSSYNSTRQIPMKDLANIPNNLMRNDQGNKQPNSAKFSNPKPSNNLIGVPVQSAMDIVATQIPKNLNSFAGNKENIIDFESLNNFKAKTEEDLQYLNQKHEEIINIILAEEEEVIAAHRQHIDDTVELTKQEMMILNEVEKPASDIDDYIGNLEILLNHKLDLINQLKSKVTRLRDHLRDEENLSKKFYEQRNEAMDVFDLNGEKREANEEGLLLDDI